MQSECLKTTEIGQSAAKPPYGEEGSETRHSASDHLVEDDGIVQTCNAVISGLGNQVR